MRSILVRVEPTVRLVAIAKSVETLIVLPFRFEAGLCAALHHGIGKFMELYTRTMYLAPFSDVTSTGR